MEMSSVEWPLHYYIQKYKYKYKTARKLNPPSAPLAQRQDEQHEPAADESGAEQTCGAPSSPPLHLQNVGQCIPPY
jgi:hypothetical protein